MKTVIRLSYAKNFREISSIRVAGSVACIIECRIPCTAGAMSEAPKTRGDEAQCRRPEGPRAGVGFLGRGSEPPLHQLGCLSEPTTKIWMKVDPYYQRRRCSPMTLDSGSIRFILYTDHRCKKRFFSVFYKSLKNMFLCFFYFSMFLCFFDVVFLLLLKHKRTKLQIWCISLGQIAVSPVFDLFCRSIIDFIWFVLTVLLTWMDNVFARFLQFVIKLKKTCFSCFLFAN